jgi:hypothetical protein
MTEKEKTILELSVKMSNALNDTLLSLKKKGEWEKKLSELYLFAEILNELKTKIPEGWVPTRIAVSCLLTMQSNVKNLQFPKKIEDWVYIWEKELKPLLFLKENIMKKSFSLWLQSKNHYRFVDVYSDYYVSYWQNINNNLSKSAEHLKHLGKLQSNKDVLKFWRQFDGVGLQYSKNLPMDEMDKRFKNYIKIDTRLNSILKDTKASNLNQNDKEKLFLIAGSKIGLDGWHTDRLCFNFRDLVRYNFQKNIDK